MLRSLRLKNWKSFGEPKDGDQGTLVPFAPLTFLVGPNGSGKSNALDALRFFQGAASDLAFADVLQGRSEGQREVWPGIRGSVVEAARKGGSVFELGASWELQGRSLLHTIAIDTQNSVELTTERLSEGERWLVFTPDGQLDPRPVDSIGVEIKASTGTKTFKDLFRASRSVLGQVRPLPAVAEDAVAACLAVRQAARDVTFLDIRPERMRAYRPDSAKQLGVSGENISPVLAALDPVSLGDVVDWLTELVAPELEKLDFDRTDLREVMMFFVEKGGQRVSARSASDETLRFLGYLVALRTATPGSLIVLEEPDVGLHPSRIRLLAELLETVSRRHGVQIIATTHSPTLLAHLSEFALADVIAFGRDPSTNATLASRIGDLPTFATLKDSSNLEHLVSTGWLERAL